MFCFFSFKVGWLMLLSDVVFVIRRRILCFDRVSLLNKCFCVIVSVFFIFILRLGLFVLLMVLFMDFWFENLLKLIIEGCGELLNIIILILFFFGEMGNKWEIFLVRLFIICVVCFLFLFLKDVLLLMIILRLIMLYFESKYIICYMFLFLI